MATSFLTPPSEFSITLFLCHFFFAFPLFSPSSHPLLFSYFSSLLFSFYFSLFSLSPITWPTGTSQPIGLISAPFLTPTSILTFSLQSSPAKVLKNL
jgi:hypothetical protein